MLGDHTRATAEAFGKQTAQLNQVLANNSAVMQQTANQVGAQSKEAVSILTSQTQTLREVSRGLLDQIHGLTQRFENQGQAILTAAKALDSSNTKIDSILEGRHQAIIALLHTVNTKAQDLDNMMRSYAGMVENAMSQAEARAKQIGTALARDTTGQAQQALAQIERLREEAQGHTARAVTDLKGSFETIITQIGRQLEQMRGTFDNTSRGMREAAQKTATDLDGLRAEMQKRMESLPEQTAQATAAIRKALNDQIKEIEAITPNLTRAATQSAPAQQAAAPRPGGFDLPPMPRDARPAAGQYDMPPLPAFEARGRQAQGPGHDDLGHATGGLAQQLAGASQSRGQAPAAGGGSWSVGDLLSRATEADQGYGSGGQSFGTRAAPPAQAAGGGGQLRLDEIARAIDYRTASDVWQRFRSGERGVLGRHIYSVDGQATFDEISRRYDRENDFRSTVDRYIGDFERLLGEAEASDPDGRILQNYLTSESGRVYLLLAHASGRLR
jgi:predicted DNA-binding protein